RKAGRKRELCYVGVHWDGHRHSGVLKELARRNLIRIYGPRDSWVHVGEAWAGFIPFDGTSLLSTLESHGAVLCLHKDEHVQCNTPSMRIFEALAVGAIPICDGIQFAKDNISEFARFVEPDLNAVEMADCIEGHLDAVNADLDDAQTMGARGNEWLNNNFSLEQRLTDVVLPFVKTVRQNMYPQQIATSARTSSAKLAKPATARFSNPFLRKALVGHVPECTVVVRGGGRDIKLLRRALMSLEACAENGAPIQALVVDYLGRSDIEKKCTDRRYNHLHVQYHNCENTGYRSTALWCGINAVETQFVAHMDDDDTIFPNHYHLLLDTIKTSDLDFAYSGVVRHEDEPGFYSKPPNFEGPLDQEIQEPRELKFLDRYSRSRLLRYDNYIQSNAWIARTKWLQPRLGNDPNLEVVEDMYLYLLSLNDKGFAFTGSATAVWHWRSQSEDNSMLSFGPVRWSANLERVGRRAANLGLEERFAAKGTHEVAITTPLLGAVHRFTADEIIPGESLQAKSKVQGFHEPDSLGVWSSDRTATIELKLDKSTFRARPHARITYIGSLDGRDGREVSFECGPHVYSAEVVDWEECTVGLELEVDKNGDCRIDIISSHIISPGDNSGETRGLGVFVSKIVLLDMQPAEELQPNEK
ncbi:MAG: glycosyltransferase, partial [Pseudomonadota bacterium]